jgi:hypothetical protein
LGKEEERVKNSTRQIDAYGLPGTAGNKNQQGHYDLSGVLAKAQIQWMLILGGNKPIKLKKKPIL